MKIHDANALFYILTSLTTCCYSIKVLEKQKENPTPSDVPPQPYNFDETSFTITDFIPNEPGNLRVPKSDLTFSEPLMSSNISTDNVEKPKKYLRTQSNLQYNATRVLIKSSSRSNAAWMSGHHGLSYTIAGGFNILTFSFHVEPFIQQFRGLLGYGIKWFILNLSNANTGDTYTAPHRVLSNLNRGSTPKFKKGGRWKAGDRPLERFSHRDLFKEIMVGLDSIGVKVIAYMSAQGPAMLMSGEVAAYDYNNRSPYVDSCRLCPNLTNTTAPFCECAPSVWRWKRHVFQEYNNTDDDTLKRAYAEIIVGEYARKYGDQLAGFVFDQAHQADIPRIYDVIKVHNPNAVLAFNKGQRIPLNNNNPPYEDFTFGLPSYVNTKANNCANYPMITSLEDTDDGFYYENGKGSLGHIHAPLNGDWSSGGDIWKFVQAREWQSRVMAANGAWTWNVKRARTGENSLIHEDNLNKLQKIYKNLSMKYPYKFDCGIPYFKPSNVPSVQRSSEPSTTPSVTSSDTPSVTQSQRPLIEPSSILTTIPSIMPSVIRSQRPSLNPSILPTTTPSLMPSVIRSQRPSLELSAIPTATYSVVSSITHSQRPSSEVLEIRTTTPSIMPSVTHSQRPSLELSAIPTATYSVMPSVTHSQRPSSEVFAMPTTAPSFKPSRIPTGDPSSIPSIKNSHNQSFKPSEEPSYSPLAIPSNIFTYNPSVTRSQGLSFKRSRIPTSHPSSMLLIKKSQNQSFTPSSITTNTPSIRPFLEQFKVSTTPTSILSAILSIDDKSQQPSIPLSPKPSIKNQGPTLIPSTTPNTHSREPSITKSQKPSFKISATPTISSSTMPSMPHLQDPSVKLSQIPTVSLSSSPSIPKSGKPSSKPSTLLSISISSIPSSKRVVVPSFIPSKKYHTSLKPFTSFKETIKPTFISTSNSTFDSTYNQTWMSPSSSPTNRQINDLPSLLRSDSHHNASWMSGHHGISFRIPGGVNYLSSYFDVDAFIQQIIEISQSPDYGIRWVIVSLSSSNKGDRYVAPHSVLTRLNRGSTSKKIPEGEWETGNMPLEQYDDRDLFGEILDGLDSIGVKTIAYMAAQGPAMLQWGEEKAYDYNNKSPYIDSCALCPSLTNTQAPFCGCAPSVWHWRYYVLEQYNSVVDKAQKTAYVEKIVDEYASRYGEKLAGYVFDQVQNYNVYEIKQIHDAIRTHNKKAVLAFNRGQRIPLKNNNAPYEDFTYGYPKDLRETEASSCKNYPVIVSMETESTGYLYDHGKESLGHIHTSINERWTSGRIVWSMERAQEWQSRMMIANGAWTWGVQLGKRNDRSVIRNDDMLFLKKLYKGLGNHSSFEDDDCELSELTETSSHQRNNPTGNRSPSVSVSVNPSIKPPPSSKPSKAVKKAEWMSGHYGISFRISGGVSYISSFYDVDAFIQQFTNSLLNYGIRWVIVNLSHSHRGDRYLAPHSVLTNINRGSTPKAVPRGLWRKNIDMPLERYDDRDLFGEILDGLDSIGVKTIAYMSSQGPDMAEWGEERAYDYNNKSPYVDSCALCPSLTNTQAPFCGCAPSVWQWKRYVFEQYGSRDDNALKRAYAEKIVGEYASRYGETLAGFAFDHVSGSHTDISLLESNVRAHNPMAVLSFERGTRIPLQHNSYPFEDFTFGYPNDLRFTVASSCENYPAITSIETTSDGFLYDNGKGSLGHVHTPINKSWLKGDDMVWNIEQAQEWQSRMMNAKGAWTWGVTFGVGRHYSLLSLYDVEFLERVYAGLRDGGPYEWTCG